jgi:hypothetical protein
VTLLCCLLASYRKSLNVHFNIVGLLWTSLTPQIFQHCVYSSNVTRWLSRVGTWSSPVHHGRCSQMSGSTLLSRSVDALHTRISPNNSSHRSMKSRLAFSSMGSLSPRLSTIWIWKNRISQKIIGSAITKMVSQHNTKCCQMFCLIICR